MLDTQTFLIQGKPLPDGGWALWSDVDDRGAQLAASSLRSRLFPWHERSMYGVLLEQGIPERTEALRLSAYDALDYLAEPGTSLYLPVEWSGTLQKARQAARLLRQALDKGWYRPNPAAWQQGELDWQLLLPQEAQEELVRLDQELAPLGVELTGWFSKSVEQLLTEEPDIADAWSELLEQEPMLGRYRADAEAARDERTRTERRRGRAGGAAAAVAVAASSERAGTAEAVEAGGHSESAEAGAAAGGVERTEAASVGGGDAVSASKSSAAAALDVEGWLVTVGWKKDDIPFRVALQLVEPQLDGLLGSGDEGELLLTEPEEAVWSLSLIVQDKQDPALLIEQELEGETPQGLYEAVISRKKIPKHWEAALERKLASDLERVILVVPELLNGGSDTSAGQLKGQLTDEEAWRFLDEDSLKLLQAGFQVYLPSWWEELRRTQPRLKAQLQGSAGSGSGSILGIDQLMQFDWKVAVGNTDFTDVEFARLAAANKRLMHVRGRWIQLDPAFIVAVRKAMKRIGQGGSLSFREIMELHLLEAELAGGAAADDLSSELGPEEAEKQLRIEVELNSHIAGLIGQLQHTDRIPVLKAPKGLQASLRSYQQDGLSWLLFLRKFGLGACLADDMGLGKTIQFIGYLLHARQEQQVQEGQAETTRPKKRPGRPRKVEIAGAKTAGAAGSVGSGNEADPAASAAAREGDGAAAGSPDQQTAPESKPRLPGQESLSAAVRPASMTSTGMNSRPPGLLICPTSVLGNWQKELTRFAPSLRVYLHYGPQRVKGDEFAQAVQGYDLVLTSYTLAQMDEEELSTVIWDVIGLDEAQNIKNVHTKQSAAVRKLDARHRIALTGTPIENRLTELWSIFDFINPGYLGTLGSFTHKYVNPIEKGGDEELVGQVQRLIKPFLLRRVKKDPAIQLDLPDKTESKVYVPLTLEQATLYENTVQDMLERIDALAGMEKKGLILATLTKLKQICNHPALFLKEPADAAWEDRSSKLERLLELVDELREEGDSCLIFTQFVEMGHLLKAALERERGEKVLFLHGGVPKKQRDEMIASFQGELAVEPGTTSRQASSPADSAGRRGGSAMRQSGVIPSPSEAKAGTPSGGGIFILSLKAGGTGLNLTTANHVFHFDRWWNPAVENQATDRAFRIGQTRNVQVHKFVALGTLEERIDEMIERKLGLSEQIVGTGENWVTEMSTDELREMFVLRREWIGKA
ncbi:DEAD/DEAH box helicase [Paenibacillus puerhi]|uniref:DEAD/DEAH box helicase n=1 Tax=Paenibacillus puerhi TaxID=2692622 RepID=UPI00135AB170|nr:DEAD/DEAH box helicase [Paenibacillus puerhi]